MVLVRRVYAWFLHYPAGRCSHCHLPWGTPGCEPHYLTYEITAEDVRKGVFFACQWCWPRTSERQRAEYLELRLFQWGSLCGDIDTIRKRVLPQLAKPGAPR